MNVNCVKTVLMALTSAEWCYQKCINRRIMPFRISPDRMGPLGKPPASLALLPSRTHQEPVAVGAVALHSSNINAGMKQYNRGRTQPLLLTRHWSTEN
jgi:hypothetical protein